MQRLKELYNQEIAPKIMQKFGYKNIMRVPKFTKVVVHSGIGKDREDKKLIAASYMKEDPLKTFHQQARKTDFSEKVQNLMSPDNFMFSD